MAHRYSRGVWGAQQSWYNLFSTLFGSCYNRKFFGGCFSSIQKTCGNFVREPLAPNIELVKNRVLSIMQLELSRSKAARGDLRCFAFAQLLAAQLRWRVSSCESGSTPQLTRGRAEFG